MQSPTLIHSTPVILAPRASRVNKRRHKEIAMKKLIAVLAIALAAPIAFAQTATATPEAATATVQPSSGAPAKTTHKKTTKKKHHRHHAKKAAATEAAPAAK